MTYPAELHFVAQVRAEAERLGLVAPTATMEELCEALIDHLRLTIDSPSAPPAGERFVWWEGDLERE